MINKTKEQIQKDIIELTRISGDLHSNNTPCELLDYYIDKLIKILEEK